MPRPASTRRNEGRYRQYVTKNKDVGHGLSRAIAGLKACATPGAAQVERNWTYTTDC